jgi:hypothetical protein
MTALLLLLELRDSTMGKLLVLAVLLMWIAWTLGK